MVYLGLKDVGKRHCNCMPWWFMVVLFGRLIDARRRHCDGGCWAPKQRRTSVSTVAEKINLKTRRPSRATNKFGKEAFARASSNERHRLLITVYHRLKQNVIYWFVSSLPVLYNVRATLPSSAGGRVRHAWVGVVVGSVAGDSTVDLSLTSTRTAAACSPIERVLMMMHRYRLDCLRRPRRTTRSAQPRQ